MGSHLGNSQLVRVHPSAIGSIQSDTLTIPDRIETVGPNYLLHGEDEDDKMGLDSSKNMHGLVVKTKGTHVEVLETFPNIAPVVDAVSADVDGSGQVHTQLSSYSTLNNPLSNIATNSYLFWWRKYGIPQLRANRGRF